MTPETLQIIGIVVVALIVIGVVAWLLARRSRAGTVGTHRHGNDLSAIRTEMENLRDRNKMLEERFERYEHTSLDVRETLGRFREDVEARLQRLSAHDDAQKALQEQIFEIRKEHQILMERDDRHERRLTELMDQLSALRSEMASQHDGRKVHR